MKPGSLLSRERSVVLGTMLFGLAAWLICAWASGKSEAWDSGAYFFIAIPLMFLGAVVAGFLSPARFWCWGFCMVLPQAVALFLTSPFGPFWALGVIIFLVLAGFLTMGSKLGARAGNAANSRKNATGNG